MKDKIVFHYATDDGLNISMTMDGDCNLTELTARFVDFTRMIGYQSGSWEDVLTSLNEDEGINSDFTAYDWASVILYG